MPEISIQNPAESLTCNQDMRPNALKYLCPLMIYVFSALAFTRPGWITWSPVLFVWVFVPILELFLPADDRNFNEAEEALAKKDRLYDYLLYAIVPIQFAALFLFIQSLQATNMAWWELTGRIMSMGLLCGTFGINVAHELGHRVNPVEQAMAKLLLLTSLYMHFFIEHNKGHHKHVATPQDPSSARYNELLYLFLGRSVWYSYWSAWRIANEDMRKSGRGIFHWKNEMLQAQIIQILFVVGIFLFFGWLTTVYFLCAAILGISMLETVNYIEHYGLQRRQLDNGKYERTLPIHSWNSNHLVGRLMLFELSRHSDHHYMASRKYQILRHHDDVPQLPTGYPGSMMLALVPPAWFYVMNKRVEALKTMPRSAEVADDQY